ncbi:hypothetical protein BFP72_16995 [Reichenbachiella sp. 5M10]|uniref:hypothetical protein n=1 Tax=Reichenbachiella sp. 5M10 TaxID=1889772 RepID=UPI000C151D39|nr:hypothetical protein [Reichenbachiella sp. 5M10]PIB36979.1 hypothetical protein BFP72_16995 [Reichenbachiella sp. 5M10]
MKYLLMTVLLSLSIATAVLGQYRTVQASDYALLKTENQRALLILFPGYGGSSETIKRELDIVEKATSLGVSVLLMSFNQHLYLKPKDQEYLAQKLLEVVEENHLKKDRVVIGGFSSGGNVSLLLSNYLIKSHHDVQPQKVFVVDAPVDLRALYLVAEKNVERNFSEASVQEGRWLMNLLNAELGDPEEGIEQYERFSPYTAETNDIHNVASLRKTQVRFYTEPDIEWWRENRKNEPEDLNAYSIKQLADRMMAESKRANVELITTENAGFRANGERHPHAWSIVEVDELLSWVLKQ